MTKQNKRFEGKTLTIIADVSQICLDSLKESQRLSEHIENIT